VVILTLLTPNLAGKVALSGHERCKTGVAVARGSDGTANARLGAQSWVSRSFVAASVIAATAGLALAQNNQSPNNQSPNNQSAPAAAPTVINPAAQQPEPQTSPPASPGLTSPPQPPLASAALPPAPAEQQHGFFDNLGRWWHDSVADFNAKLKEQQSKLDDFNKKSAAAAKEAAAATQEAMSNAAAAMVKLPASKVIEIHELCAIAGNGAADCATAAANACKGKGFKDGQPLDVRTAEKCNASLWMSGQSSAAADCPVETVVLRAACQ
jgi:hypothetical protein